MEDILLLLVLLGATTQGTSICPQATYRVVPDAADVGLISQLIGDTLAVHVRSQCALYCQQTPGCKNFAVCNTSSATAETTLTMATSECVLMRDSPTTGSTQTLHNASQCVVFTEQNTTDPSDVKDNDTTGSTPQPTLESTTKEYSPFSDFFSGFLKGASSTTFWADLETVTSPSVAVHVTECMVNMAANFNDVYVCRLERDGRALDIPWYRNQVVVQVRSGCGGQDFNRSWSEYSAGFGSVQSGCFWLGNSNISYLTTDLDMEWDLGAVLTNTSSHSQLVWYDTFTLGSEGDGFRLHYKTYQWSGAGQGSSSDHGCMDGFGGNQKDNNVHDKRFYTYDSDDVTSCASKHGAGWWYNKKCSHGNLNHVDSPMWPDDTGNEVEYKSSFMSLQLKYFGSSSGNGNGGE